MIIGLTGSFAAGKDTVARILERHGFQKYVYSDYVRRELDARGLDHSRDNMIVVANEIRRKHGAGELSRRILDDALKEDAQKMVVVGIRNPEEVKVLKQQQDCEIWFVDAPVEIRYQRAVKRKSSKDEVSFEKFRQQEETENSTDPVAQQLGTVASMADVTIMNNGSQEELEQQILQRLNQFGI